MKNKYKRKRKIISTYKILIIFIVIIICMSIGYSYWSDTLTINGTATAKYKEPELECEPTKPSGGSSSSGTDRWTTNTKLTGGLFGIQAFSVVEDTYEDNEIVTNIAKGNSTLFGAISATFTLNISNTSQYIFKNGTVQYEEYDENNVIDVSSKSLSKVTLEPGETAVLTVTVSMENTIWKSPKVGSYMRFKISYDANGIKQYFNYTIKIVK